jgi:acetyl esterase/lipase
MANKETNVMQLWDENEAEGKTVDGFRPHLERYLVETKTARGAVLICPGGGYSGRAAHEGEPVARRFNDAGFHAFVAQYRVAPNRHPGPIRDAARAMRLIRLHAPTWNVATDHIAICGFSAGGHLAASLSVLYNRPCLKSSCPVDQLDCRPNASILCYPVITSGPFMHRGSFMNLLGKNAPADLLKEMSLELQVDAKTPPAFLWHTQADGGVPVENSILYAQALRKNRVPFELHIYQEGRHGLGLAPDDPHVATWMLLACQWLKLTGGPGGAGATAPPQVQT